MQTLFIADTALPNSRKDEVVFMARYLTVDQLLCSNTLNNVLIDQ